MSIFGEGFGGLNPMPWIKEKALAALHDAARFVDLANEPDTTTWYARRLREPEADAVSELGLRRRSSVTWPRSSPSYTARDPRPRHTRHGGRS